MSNLMLLCYDAMHPKFIKIPLPFILTYFTHLLNTIINTSTFPSMWKHAKILSILKPDKSFRSFIYILYIFRVFIKGFWEINTYADKPSLIPCSDRKNISYKISINYTYIHNWPITAPFSQEYWPSFSHHLCCVC